RVVLPVPGGPHRISDIGASLSTSRRSGVSGPSKCRWPTTSSRVRGRIRTASGSRTRRAPGSAAESNRLSTTPTLPSGAPYRRRTAVPGPHRVVAHGEREQYGHGGDERGGRPRRLGRAGGAAGPGEEHEREGGGAEQHGERDQDTGEGRVLLHRGGVRPAPGHPAGERLAAELGR